MIYTKAPIQKSSFLSGRSVKEIGGKLCRTWWREALPGKTYDRIQSVIKLWKINVSEDVDGLVSLRKMQDQSWKKTKIPKQKIPRTYITEIIHV